MGVGGISQSQHERKCSKSVYSKVSCMAILSFSIYGFTQTTVKKCTLILGSSPSFLPVPSIWPRRLALIRQATLKLKAFSTSSTPPTLSIPTQGRRLAGCHLTIMWCRGTAPPPLPTDPPSVPRDGKPVLSVTVKVFRGSHCLIDFVERKWLNI